MFGAALFEILILVLVRPLRLLVGLLSKRAAQPLQRVEDWLLHQVHAMGVEARTVYELEKRGEAKAHLASGTFDKSSADIPGMSGDATEHARRLAGAPMGESTEQSDDPRSLKRQPTQVEARTGQTRSEEMQDALLRAQREERARAERESRRRL